MATAPSLPPSPPPRPPRTWTIGELLQSATDFFSKKGIEDARLSAELLLAHALGCSRLQLYTQYERVPDDTQRAAFRELVRQRSEHAPVQYLTGKASFFSMDLLVTRDVLIPRPDTETLVEQVITRVRQTPGWESPNVLDLCTGSGCIAVALAKHLPTAHVVGVDVSEKAVAVARQNAELQKVADRVEFLIGDLLAPVHALQPPRKFHVLVSNPPYIPTGEIPSLPPTVRDHEPRIALDGGPDGLAVHRRILAEAGDLLEPGALVAMEIEYRQAEPAQAVFAEAGYLENIRMVRDAAGNPRCVMGSKKS